MKPGGFVGSARLVISCSYGTEEPATLRRCRLFLWNVKCVFAVVLKAAVLRHGGFPSRWRVREGISAACRAAELCYVAVGDGSRALCFLPTLRAFLYILARFFADKHFMFLIKV